ncbi:hypothetical protein F511_26708 [Dorcoceras hygrometricum]|uniref:Uncharacterized protein n=1 Tax=Dorcoceras hygrometricum TaxID=472368 RepID=A0A2Z7BZM0_9LAMI|nr:hypothetical protein F511_26708 [Dorcoceras hygrometricum]
MEHSRMVRMFKTLGDTGLKGFLEVSNSVYEGAVLESNAKVIEGTVISFIANRKLVITKDVFAEEFGLPFEGLVGFLGIPTETMVEMRCRFSGSEVPFRTPNKKKEMKMEYRLLHDIVAKALCAKEGSFDMVTSEKFDFMVAITTGLKVNWAQVLFQVLVGMVNCPNRQSQGFTVQLSQSSSITKDGSTASELQSTADGPQAHPKEPEKADVEKPKKKKERIVQEGKKQKVVVQQPVEAGSQTALAKFTSETSSNEDSRPLAGLKKRRGAKHKQVVESSDSEAIMSVPPVLITKKHRTKRTKKFRTGYRLSKITSMKLVEEFAKMENKLLPWAKMDKVSELLQTRDLIWYNMVELHLREAVAEHWKNFHKDKPSANQDIMAIPQRAQPTHSTPDERTDREPESQNPEPTMEGHIEEVDRTVENVEESEVEQPAPEEEDQPQKSPTHFSSSYGSSARFTIHNEDSVDSMGPYSSFSVDPSLSLSPSLNLGHIPSNLQMVVYTKNREENNGTDQEEKEVSTRAGPQPISLPTPQFMDIPPKELTSLQDSASSLDLKFECFKAESTLVHKLADNQPNLAALETDLVRHFADNQQHLVDEVALLKSQVAEMVEYLKELRDSKKGEVPSSKQGEGPSNKKGKERATLKREDGFDQGWV